MSVSPRHYESIGGRVVWLSGRPGAGKSTLAEAFCRRLRGCAPDLVHLDGDDLRRGLCADLGFGPEARRENLRRAAHVARMMSDVGHTVICSFITPLEDDRRTVRDILGDRMIHVYVEASVETCEHRDPKGHYRRARAGEMKEFTGISAPFECPSRADLVLATERYPVAELVEALVCRVRTCELEYVI